MLFFIFTDFSIERRPQGGKLSRGVPDQADEFLTITLKQCSCSHLLRLMSGLQFRNFSW